MTENKNIEDTGLWQKVIVPALVGLSCSIIGIGLQAWLGLITTKQDKAIVIGREIIANVERLAADQSSQDTIVQEVLNAMAEGEIYKLDRIKADIRRPVVSPPDVATQKTTDTTPGNSKNKKPAAVTDPISSVWTSSSETSIKNSTIFKSSLVFLLIKPEKKLKSVLVNWDDSEGFQQAELHTVPRLGHFSTSHYYSPGKTVRNIVVRVTYQDNSQETIATTIFTYL